MAGLNSRRATGPWVCKNCSCRGSATAPGSAEPTLAVHFRRRGGPCGRPQAFPLPGGRWHGEAVTDEGNRQIFPFPISRPPGEGAPVRTLGRMRGTVPVMRAVYSTRRGGTLGRPSPLGSDACRVRLPGRAVPVAHRTPQGRPLRSSIGPSPIQRKDGWSLTRRMRVRAWTAFPAPGQRTLLQKCHT